MKLAKKTLFVFFFFGLFLIFAQNVFADTVQEVVAQSTIGEKVNEISGDSFYAYPSDKICPDDPNPKPDPFYGCQIVEPPPPTPRGWKNGGFDNSFWSNSVDAYNFDGASQWWCLNLPSNCFPLSPASPTFAPGDPDQITGPSGFTDRESILFLKPYTINPPLGYQTTQVNLELWSDNNSWAYIEGALITTGGLDRVATTNLPNEAVTINITALALSSFTPLSTFIKHLAIQVSNDEVGGSNPIGVSYRITATYESIPPTPTPTPTSTPVSTPIPTAPTLGTLDIKGNVPTGFLGKTNTVGRLSTQGGKSWNNPITITLNANQGTNPVKEFYVSFFTVVATDLDDAKTKANTPLNGFLLKYDDSTKKFYYYYGVWKEIIAPEGESPDKNQFLITPGACPEYPTPAPTSGPTQAVFCVTFYPSFGSKVLNASAHVKDTAGLPVSSTFEARP